MAITSVDFNNAIRVLVATMEESNKHYTVKIAGLKEVGIYTSVSDAVKQVLNNPIANTATKVLITTNTLSVVVYIEAGYEVTEIIGNSELATEFVNILNFTL